jgi:glutamine synthetase
MAGLDGIRNKIHPGEAMDKDLYDLPPEEEKKIPQVSFSLEQALEEMSKDREFLKAGDVFTDDLIDGYIDLKMQDVTRVRMTTHPVEFELYYSL